MFISDHDIRLVQLLQRGDCNIPNRKTSKRENLLGAPARLCKWTSQNSEKENITEVILIFYLLWLNTSHGSFT